MSSPGREGSPTASGSRATGPTVPATACPTLRRRRSVRRRSRGSRSGERGGRRLPPPHRPSASLPAEGRRSGPRRHHAEAVDCAPIGDSRSYPDPPGRATSAAAPKAGTRSVHSCFRTRARSPRPRPPAGRRRGVEEGHREAEGQAGAPHRRNSSDLFLRGRRSDRSDALAQPPPGLAHRGRDPQDVADVAQRVCCGRPAEIQEGDAVAAEHHESRSEVAVGRLRLRHGHARRLSGSEGGTRPPRLGPRTCRGSRSRCRGLRHDG